MQETTSGRFVFIHRLSVRNSTQNLSAQKPKDAQKSLCTAVFTRFYTLLHTDALTQKKPLHTHKNLCTQHAFAHNQLLLYIARLCFPTLIIDLSCSPSTLDTCRIRSESSMFGLWIPASFNRGGTAKSGSGDSCGA